MPTLKSTRAAISRLPTGAPLVVALVGGTTGIGSYTARALATTFANQGKKLRVYIVGRRADRAEQVIAYGRATTPGSDWRFVQSPDLALLSEVARVSADIIAQEEKEPFGGGKPRVDVLYLSAALSPLQESPRKLRSMGIGRFIGGVVGLVLMKRN
jgi:NAD(P)-dependent dehydrogenase (short-subunit alcohol dehydrogenase family)